MSATLSRRDFLQATVVAGAGLTIAFALPSCAPGAQAPVTTPFQPNAWVRISTDGSVTLVVDRSEMGQGVLTALPMLLAEELDVPWESVHVEQAPAGRAYINPDFGVQGTGGSSSVHAAWNPLRKAGAQARAVLIDAAASDWGVLARDCDTEPGSVVHQPTQRRLPYGELVVRAAKLPIPETVPLRDASSYRIIGTSVPRLDTPDKVRGKAGFGIDAAVPGLLVAMVARCPTFGGSAKSWNEAAAKQVPGVKHVVKLTSGIAVVADGYWQAHQGREALAVVWDEGPNAQLSSEAIRKQFDALLTEPGMVARKEGNPAVHGAREVVAVYEAPYQAHACMEPMNATADVRSDACTVWAPTQFQMGSAFGKLGALETAAAITGLPADKIIIHTTLMGGGFGRRFFNDFIAEALEASKAVAAPVKVIWSREDDIQHDYYRPAARASFRAQLAADGTPVGLSGRVAAPSISVSLGAPKDKVDENSVDGVLNLPYDIPNVLIESINAQVAVPLGFWRSVGSSQNGFMTECFIDELAWAAGKDPVAFRRALLGKKPRHLAVLELAADKAGWSSAPPAGRARGVAVLDSFSSYVAEVAEVSLNADRTIRVHRVVAAVDCGIVVNPDIVTAQVESAIVYGLTAALAGAITIDKGRVTQSNFHDYPLLRMRDMPVVEVHLVSSTALPTGIGEPGTPPIAAAVGNAVYALTKQRIRQLPFGAVPA